MLVFSWRQAFSGELCKARACLHARANSYFLALKCLSIAVSSKFSFQCSASVVSMGCGIAMGVFSNIQKRIFSRRLSHA